MIMGKRKAQTIARSGITWGQIHAMLDRAHVAGVETDPRQSRVNKQFTKAQIFDILDVREGYAPERAVTSTRDRLVAVNCLREFGEFWI